MGGVFFYANIENNTAVLKHISSNMAYPNLHFASPMEKRGLTNVISGINYMNVKYIDALCLEG